MLSSFDLLIYSMATFTMSLPRLIITIWFVQCAELFRILRVVLLIEKLRKHWNKVQNFGLSPNIRLSFLVFVWNARKELKTVYALKDVVWSSFCVSNSEKKFSTRRSRSMKAVTGKINAGKICTKLPGYIADRILYISLSVRKRCSHYKKWKIDFWWPS